MAEDDPVSDSFDNLLADAQLGSVRHEDATTQAVQRALRRRTQTVLGGRYELLTEIGRGGMGTVWEAVDRRLDRRVAIKRLTHGSLDGLARLAREAQAVARLQHPAIVAVFDVATDVADPYIVMELVRGPTLHVWQTERPWPEIVAAYLQAGEGLAAAHAAGLVHRDFKPQNVMVETSSRGKIRARVLDFGLVLDRGSAVADEATPDSGVSTGGNPRITATGTAMGTPAYMAPEQFRGDQVGPAADQFAFCVALWGALYGERPFCGRSLSGLYSSIQTGELASVSESDVPRRIEAALRIGLAPDPGDRHASLAVLLDVLRVRRGAARRITVGVALAVLIAGGAWVVGSGPTRPCAHAQARLQGVWDDERRRAIRSAVAATERTYAGEAAAHVDDNLQRYATAWTTMHTEACEAAASNVQSPADLDVRMACLERARSRLVVVSDLLAIADGDLVSHATSVVSGLPPLARCADLEALRAAIEPPDASQAQAVAAARESLVHAATARSAGDFAAARDHVEQARARVRDVDYQPVQAEIALEDGEALRQLGEFDASEESLKQAVRIGTAYHQRELVARAATWLMHTVGDGQRRPSEALELGNVAARFAGDDALLRSRLHNATALLLMRMGRQVEAEAEARAAVALQHEAFGPEGAWRFTTTQSTLAVVLAKQGRSEEAIAELTRIMEIEISNKGPGHPDTIRSRHNLGLAMARADRYAEADAVYSEAVAIAVRSLPPHAPALSSLRTAHAIVLLSLDRIPEATAAAEQALADRISQFGADHPVVGTTHITLSMLASAAGDADAALASAERAWAIIGVEEIGPTIRGRTALTLVRALDAVGEDSSRARRRQLVQEARAAYLQAGPSGVERVRELDQWLGDDKP